MGNRGLLETGLSSSLLGSSFESALMLTVILLRLERVGGIEVILTSGSIIEF